VKKEETVTIEYAIVKLGKFSVVGIIGAQGIREIEITLNYDEHDSRMLLIKHPLLEQAIRIPTDGRICK
jgi:hypothetical protein